MKCPHFFLTFILIYLLLRNLAYSNHRESLVNERVMNERLSQKYDFIITPHKANYLIPFSYNHTPHQTPFETIEGQEHPNSIENIEARFQISIKVPLWNNIFWNDGHLFFAFTSQSWWQLYNKVISSPFRETDYEPEFFLLFHNDWEIGHFTNSLWNIGISHQSNGQTGNLSRSWNRIYAHMLFDGGNLVFIPKVWWRIPQKTIQVQNIIYGDDNPEIGKYIGHFELLTIYVFKRHRFSMLLRNNLRKNNRGAIKLTWSYPIYQNLRIYTEYFNGYGDSLLEYRTHTQVFGIGISLNDLL